MSWNSSFRTLSGLLRVLVRQPIVLSIKKNSSLTRAEPLKHEGSSSCNAYVRLANSKGINVEWIEGGKTAREDYYHGVWLRHNCHCPLCLNNDANQNMVDSAQLNKPTVTHAAVNGDNVELTWKVDVGEHSGYIPLQFLQENRYSNDILIRDSKQSRPDKTVEAKMNQMPEIDAKSILTSDEGLWRWLWNLTEYGMCIINGVSTISGSVMQLAERVSYVQDTLYGKVFDVVLSENPINIAYTGSSLPLHMDLVMYESPPGIQILHCLKNDVIGGESLLLDTFPVLEEMRIKHPEEFHTLTRVPATFQRVHLNRDAPARMVGQRPHIVLGENNEIVAVSWNQRIHGPLRVPPADVEPYYKAYVLLAKLFDSSERTLQVRLLPGQALSLNNRRILHGRNAFKGTSRHLQGVYFNIDEFKSKFLVLDAIYGDGKAKRVFNHSEL